MARYLWFTFVLILLLLVLCACQPVVGTAEAAANACSVEGSWVGSFSGGPWDDPLIFQSTLVPIDPAGKRLNYVIRMVNPDATFKEEGFEDADYMSELVGEAVKTGSGTYDVSLVGYAVNEREADRGEILYIWEVNGTLSCEGDNFTHDVSLEIYPIDQDADQDGLPDEGAEPVFCHNSDFGSAKRIPMSEGCTPPPPSE